VAAVSLLIQGNAREKLEIKFHKLGGGGLEAKINH
jgi:hypothetical protein